MFNHFCVIRWIKNKIPFALRIVLIELIILIEKILYLKLHLFKKVFPKDKKIFLLLSTDYSNLGDHAMSYAHKKYLEKKFPNYNIIEITVNNTLKSLYSIKKCCSQEDIITLKGGGNVGVEYFREELIRREIIKYFPNNKIVMFPQTVYFPNTEFGNLQFKKTIKIFNSNKNFYAFFRDKQSYKIMKKYLRNCFLTPDIVLSLSLSNKRHLNNDMALICLRNDIEGVYNEKDKILINQVLREFYCSIKQTDTIKTYKILLEDREKELNSIWEEFCKVSIVVTDRLHGMIFAALLGIPCIVLQNYNHKMFGQYEWLKQLNYIQYISLNKDSLVKAIKKVRKITVNRISNNYFEYEFKKIVDVIKQPLYSTQTMEIKK